MQVFSWILTESSMKLFDKCQHTLIISPCVCQNADQNPHINFM